ncbi:MAG: TonB-dependent receptor [Acidobacteriia bacterium]|nr:TonB-dependent receptor [Terriglobia bacterium]
MLRRLTVPVILGCLFSPVLLRSQPNTHLSGVICDPSTAAVAGAAVTVVNQDTGFRRLTSSQSDGSYAVVSLEPGLYKITVRHPGFHTLIRLGVRVDATQPARVDFNLPLGRMQESITVEDAPSVPLSEDTAVGTLITPQQIEHIASNGRSLTSLLEFTPGTIITPATRGEPGQFTSGGQRPNANYFSVDGVSANTGVSAGGLPAQSTGGALPAMTALGSLHGLLSLEAVSELRVETSTTAPDFGRLPGAQIVLTSRSGSNEFHGSLFDYLRNEALDANDWFANNQGDGRAPARMNDFGGSLGGPAKRDRTFFFMSYEGMRLRAPLVWRAAVPDGPARLDAPGWARPLLDLFPLPNGQELGSGLAEWMGQTDRPSRFDAANIRIDHALTSRITLFGRYSQTPSWSEFGRAQINQIAIRSRGLTLGVDVRLRSNLALNVRMNASQASLISSWGTAGSSSCDLQPVVYALLRVPDACDYLLRFSIAGVGQIASGEEARQKQTQWHAAPVVVVSHGPHEFRLGADYLELIPARRDMNKNLGIIADSVANAVDTRDLWVAVSGRQASHSVLKEDSIFAQDTWRIIPRLTASFGLRWEFTPPPELNSIAFPLANVSNSSYIFSGQTTIWQRTNTNLAPRFGLAYRPSAQSQTVLRAGWGIYYDSSLSIATDLVNGGPFSLSQFSSAQHAPFPTLLSYGFLPGLRLPSVKQWSGTVEHAFGRHHTVSAVYEGSAGLQLLRREFGGLQNSESLQLALATNHGFSRYHGFELQYRLKPSHGFSGLASYSWSHSIDNSSSDSVLYWAASGLTASSDRGSSDFDVRHAFNAALSYEAPQREAKSFRSQLLRGWGLDGIIHARTGFPITVLDADYSMGLSFANFSRPDLVGGQPVWVTDRSAPGGRRLNTGAFQPAPDLVQGNLGRNAVTGFGMCQIDLALRRDFPIGERRSLQFRIEAFNALNHPDYADPIRFLSSPLFGQSPSMLNMMLGTGSPGSGLTPVFQNGGARSVQVMLRFRF